MKIQEKYNVRNEIWILNAFAKNPRSAFAIDEKPFEMRLKNHAKTIEKREICMQKSPSKSKIFAHEFFSLCNHVNFFDEVDTLPVIHDK